LQEREFEMVGGKEKLKANCRVISATNRDLKQMVKDGQFREDLFYRLNVVSIYLPPLRERKVDIPEFALYFTAKTCKEISKDIHYISQEAIDFLMEQSWTGNVRQLENVITNAVIMSRNNRLSKEDFTAILKPEDFSAPSPSEPPSWSEAGAVLASSQDSSYKPRSLQDMEKEQIHMALAYTKWHKGKACDILGITRPRLERKIDKYGLKPLKLYYGK
jgi:two-component system response regulator AtoC